MADRFTDVHLSRRSLLGAAGGAGIAAATAGIGRAAPGHSAAPRRSRAQAGVTIQYWDGIAGGDGDALDQVYQAFTEETGIGFETQRMQWTDLFPKMQLSIPAGEGPDLALIHTVAVPSLAYAGILEPMDPAIVTERGFVADDYVEAPWQGGVFEEQRYGLPLAIPQHLLYLNTQLFTDAGMVDGDGVPIAPTNREEVLAMAQELTHDDVFGFYIQVHRWVFQNLLWQNGANLFTDDLSQAAVTEPAALEVAEFWASLLPLQVSPPTGVSVTDAFATNKLAMYIGGNWQIPVHNEAGVAFTAAPVPNFFETPAVWTLPFQYAFPAQARDAAVEEACWTFLRWITDHVADWSALAYHIPATWAAQEDPRLVDDPTLNVLSSQAEHWRIGQMTPRWQAAEDLMDPIIQALYLGETSPEQAMATMADQITMTAV